MNNLIILDEELCKRLPLPLAQLYRRAHTAKTELEQHHVAYYLWEATLKLLAAVVVLEYANSSQQRSDHVALIKNLVRPQSRDWCRILRELLPIVAHSDATLHRTHAILVCEIEGELPRCAELDVALREAAPNDPAAKPSVTLLDLFDRLVEYRKSVFKTELFVSQSTGHHERIGGTLLASIGEWLPRVDVLAGQELMFVSDVTAQGTGRWLVQRYALTGDIARRIRPLEVTGSAQVLPRSGSVYLDGALHAQQMSDTGSLASLRLLHPLVLFDVGLDQVFFLGSRAEGEATEYLCYTTGQILDPKPLEPDLRELLGLLMHKTVDATSVAVWSKQIEDEKPQAPTGAVPHHSEHTTGEFELVTRMGQGGMGVVYRAWQRSLGRQVAVKRLVHAGDPKAQARFSREIHALARVEHPHLIKILSSGTDGDRWYYAMELIDGVDLGKVTERLQAKTVDASLLDYTQWQEELTSAVRESRLSETPLDEGFNVAQLLEHLSEDKPAPVAKGSRAYVEHLVRLILQVTQATQALHDGGVVHRDIKPGNIMITASGQDAVLMDLGLAQLSDDSQNKATQTQQFIGTLRYASPEQVLSASAVDHRSDVYSLGASLWELLTLKPLFGLQDESTSLDLMQRIQYADPEPVRKYNNTVSKDLEAIITKCLEKSRDHRYQSARELAAELTRFLNNEPVQARPLTKLTRGARQIQRHPIISGFVAACVSTVVAMIVLAINVWALHTERQFTTQLQQANERADQSFRQAVKALDDIFTLVTDGDLRRRPDLQPLRTELLTYYQNYVQQISDVQGLDGPLALELAGVFRRMAKITKEVGNEQDALTHFDSAIRTYQGILDRDPLNLDLAATLSQTLIDRGVLLQETRDYEKAERDFIRARDALAELSRNDPQNYQYRSDLAEAYHSLGSLYDAENRYSQSLASFEEGRQIREQLVAESDAREFKRDLGRSYGYLGDVQISMGDYQQAQRSYRRSVEIRQQVAESVPTDHEARFQLARGFRNLGHLSRLEGDLEKAIEWYLKTTDEDRRITTEEPLILDYRRDLGSHSNDLAELLIDQGNLTEQPEFFERAERHLDEAMSMNRELALLTTSDMLAIANLARTYVSLARLALMKDVDRAREHLALSREQFKRLTSRTADDLYQQAVLEALSAQLVPQQSSDATPENASQREAYLNQSLVLLSQAAVKSRYTILPQMGRDKAFKELKSRVEFQMVSSIGFQGLDDSGQVALRGDRRLTSTTRSPFRHLSVLTVGVSNYQDAKYSLQFPDDDALALANALNQQQAFESVTIKTLTDEQADRVSILNALKQLRLQALHPSLLLVALSGHGKLHESGDYYFLPYDFDFDPAASIASTGISWDDLLREFREVPGAVIVVIDTCHSGAATDVSLRGPTADAMSISIRKAAAEISGNDDKGVAVIASSMSAQAAQERPAWGHGALSLAILEALGNQRLYQAKSKSPLPAFGANRLLSMEQIRAYIVERVNELTDGQQKVIVSQSNMSLIDIPLNITQVTTTEAAVTSQLDTTLQP
jgi:eukaryotic-like serine/threonine-protein kinase